MLTIQIDFDITYGELHELLTHFGLKKVDDNDFLYYEDKASETYFALPKGKDNEPLRKVHAASISRDLEWKGFLKNRDQFFEMAKELRNSTG